MNFFDLLKLSTRMFKARTSRTILTILGMGVGISAILFLVSLGYGLQGTLLEKITTADSILTLDVTEISPENSRLNSEMISEIEKIDGVSEVSSRLNLNSRGKVGGLVTDLTVAGVNPSFFRLGGIKIYKGEALSDKEKNGAVITLSTAQALNQSPDDIIGKEIEFVFSVPNGNGTNGSAKIEARTKYEIIGLVEEDENLAYIDSSTLDYLDISKFDQLKVKSVSNGKMGEVRGKIEGYELLVSSLSDTVDQANKVFKVIQIILGCFGVIALIVSAIGMFNTMTIALLERTNEIGIMKSIGASDLIISSMFVMEATIMGFLGAIGGVIMGLMSGKMFNFLINIIATRFGGQEVNLFSSPFWFILMIVIFGTIVGFFTGIIPARRASRLDPLYALRYK